MYCSRPALQPAFSIIIIIIVVVVVVVVVVVIIIIIPSITILILNRLPSLSPPSSSLQVVQELMDISQLQTSPHHVDFAMRCQSAVANSQSENRPQSPAKATGCLNKNGCSMKHEAPGQWNNQSTATERRNLAGKDQRHTINFESNMESQ